MPSPKKKAPRRRSKTPPIKLPHGDATARPADTCNVRVELAGELLAPTSPPPMFQRYTIPRSFTIGAHEITVIPDHHLLTHKDNCVGRADLVQDELRIQRPDPRIGHNPSRANLEGTYFHELVHILLDHSDRRDLSRDENFVEVFSRGLHQALVTAKGEVFAGEF